MSAILMTHEDYTVAWICALPLETAAAKAMLDKTHRQLSQSGADDNAYMLGEISGHNIVIACLPSGVYGTVSAATVAANMRTTFPSIRFGLMVGIGGGVPSTNNDIWLGDVVVSKPTGILGGVVQYDYGKTVASGVFQQTGMMNQPPQVLLNAIARLHADEILGNNQSIVEVMSNALNTNVQTKSKSLFSRPADEHDRLFNPAYDHLPGEDTCINCDKKQLINRHPRTSDEPQIHYGIIASGNQVMKHGETRDRLGKEYGMLCFEMEAAGLMNQLPCLVIRGICDYSDSHKNKHWQGYAALAAAAYARILLSVVSVNQLRKNLDQVSQEGCWMVPFERNPRFLGRHNEVARLQERIVSKDRVRKMAITGLGGVGKTQIALEIAYQIRDKKPEFSIFWIPATSAEKIEQAYMGIGECLRLQDVTPADMKKAVKAHLSSEKTGPWLLIIDNLDDMNMWTTSDASSPVFKTYIPQSKYGFVLFTTRNQQLATTIVGPDVISIPEMDDKIATDLLRVSLIRQDLVNDSQPTTQLLRQLSYLPLAIIQAASYMNQTGVSVATYLSFLERQEDEMVELLSQDFEDEWRYAESKNPVAVTWLISFHQIQRLNSLAADYLSFMSCVDPRDIPLSLLPPDSSQIKQQSALGLLKAYSFITGQADDQTLSLHRLVHLATRNWLQSGGMLEQWTVNTGKRLTDIFPSHAHENRILWRKYLPHALFVLQSKEFQNDTQDREDLVQKVAICLYNDGRYHEAEVLFKEVFEKKRKRLKNDDREMLTSMAWMAATYQNQGRWTEAEKLSVQVMETFKTVLGPEHPSTLASMHNLAYAYRDQGRWTEAEKLGVQVMETRKTVLGPEHPSTLISMSNLASTYQHQGRWTEAEKLGVQVMETFKTVLGPEHPDTLTSMHNLASTYKKQGRWTEAEKLEVQVMGTGKTVLGPEHPNNLTSMSNLACTYQYQGRSMEAEKLFVQVMETQKTVLGPEHPDTLTSMHNLASTYEYQGRWTEAEALFVQVLETEKTVHGPEHPSTLTSMSNLASTYQTQGRWTEAEKLSVQVMETFKTVLGPEHPDTLTSMSNLALTYQTQGRWTEAEALFVQVLETEKTVLEPEHPSTLTSMSNLASTYQNQGRWTEAEKLSVQVMETSKTVLGPEHPSTLTSMSNLASTYRDQGRWTEAEKLDVQVITTSKTVLGPEHPSTLTSMSNLASTYRDQGRWTEAEKLDVQVIETSKTVLGPEHPSTLTSMSNLASTYRAQGRWMEAEKLSVQVMETRKTVLGPEHPSTLTSMWNLSFTLKGLGRRAEALSLLQDCVQLQEQRLGPAHPHTISATAHLKAWQEEHSTHSTG
ncbi:putative kinesin [Elaphomyces granulatus]